MALRIGSVEGVVGVSSPQPFAGVYAGCRVLVTGHTGFKGSWLCSWLLNLGAVVTGYALEPDTEPSLFDALGLAQRMDHRIGDVRNRASVQRLLEDVRPQVVFHLAAQPLVRRSYAEPVETFETNIMGTAHVLDACRGVEGIEAVVVVTSDKCYENHEWEYAYRENDGLGGRDPYSASKGAAEIVTASYRRSFFGADDAAHVASVRAGNVIGGGDWADDRILPDCVRALSAGEPIIVRSPRAVRPWQHVLEPLAGYLWLGAELVSKGHVFTGSWNIGPDPSSNITVGEVAQHVVEAWGEGEWRLDDPTKSHPHEAHLLRLDCSKAADQLGLRPVWSAPTAIERAATWYRRYYDGVAAAALVGEDISVFISDAVANKCLWAACVAK